MVRVALVTSSAWPTLYDDDRLLLPALREVGIEGVPAIWDDPAIAWDAFAAIVIRSPWDYFERVPEFKEWLAARIRGKAPLMNSGDVLEWNFDKKYLDDLASRVPLVPTVCVERGSAVDVAAIGRERGWDEIVVKPTISGGGYRTWKFAVGDAGKFAEEVAVTLRDRGLLIQPYLPEIQAGELSLLFFDGEFSHAVRKRPAKGDYRVQFQFGGTNEDADVDAGLIAQARSCVLAAPSLPVYARVDGVVKDGQFLLMELEVFEPLMFLQRKPEAAGRFARAIAGRL